MAEVKASKKPEETVSQSNTIRHVTRCRFNHIHSRARVFIWCDIVHVKLWLRSAGRGVEQFDNKLPKSVDEIYKMRRLHFKDAGIPATRMLPSSLVPHRFASSSF
jgi:hypothetical protein